MPEVDGETSDAIWLINKLRWCFIDGMGSIDIRAIIEAMDLYLIPKEKQPDLLEAILTITREVLNTKGKEHGRQ